MKPKEKPENQTLEATLRAGLSRQAGQISPEEQTFWARIAARFARGKSTGC